MRQHADEPVVIVQERSSDVGSFLLGIAIGAGIHVIVETAEVIESDK